MVRLIRLLDAAGTPCRRRSISELQISPRKGTVSLPVPSHIGQRLQPEIPVDASAEGD
jgi:hypothetical protein